MKNGNILVLASLLLGFISACSYTPKKPDFINLKNVTITSANLDTVVLSGDAIFNNPNPIPGKLTKTNIHIKVNNIDITDIEQNVSIDVPKNSDFTVPVHFSFNPKQLSSEHEGFFKNALKNFLSNQLIIEYDGHVTIEILSIGFDIPVAHTDTMRLVGS